LGNTVMRLAVADQSLGQVNAFFERL